MSDQRDAADEHATPGDETVVVPRAVVPDDATVVVPRVAVPEEAVPAEVPVADATIVVPRATVPDDATVVVPRVAVPDDATVVVPRRERRESAPSLTAPQTTGDETIVVPRRPAPDVGPVADPEPQSVLPSAQSLPASRVYAARSAERQSILGSAAVGEHIGQPPEETYRADAAFLRQDLPSVARRSKRRRVLTLVGYAVTLVISVAGLATVINLAIDST